MVNLAETCILTIKQGNTAELKSETKMKIITRTLQSGKTLEISCEGTLLTATVDGKRVGSGGLTAIPAALASKTVIDINGKRVGYAMMACGNVPVTAEEARKLQGAIDKGRNVINRKIKSARAYNNLMNEGYEGYTPHAF